MIATKTVTNQTQIASSPAIDSFWQSPGDLSLEINEAHLWLTPLDVNDVGELEQVISYDERARAARFRFDLHRKQFIAARGFLRIILGKYLRTNPQHIRFEYGEFGKPSIAGESAIKFNVSHSGSLAFYAVTRSREIGVDIEQIKPSFADDGMVSFCLTAQEKAHLQTLPKNKRELFFFECWTRKEAFLKACGNGLSTPVNQIETLSYSGVPLNSLEVGFGYQTACWSLQSIPFIPGYAAAIAIQGSSPRLKFWSQTNAKLPL
jgi:4'-phosphopantetheinyl transferase